MRRKAFCILQKRLWRCGPCAELIGLRVSSPLRSYPPANFIGIDSGSFRIDIDLKQFADCVKKLFEIGSNFDNDKILKYSSLL